MSLVLSIARRIGEGQFADVFATEQPAVVCKLYRAAGSPNWHKWAPKVQESEIQAYKSAHEDHELTRHVAAFYGGTGVSAVHDGEIDRSAAYLLQTGILLERLEGPEEKATQLSPKQFPHIYRLASLFKARGVDVGDASVFNYADASRIKFIDIITRSGAQILAEI